ncbi:DUF4212 domain-containing protein [Aquibacillus kalidii]|uniref:DUF4212 domain-containing protein n=1 Tax=Aquibacillus kalidii TaxID=2762597 RepID=UPI0016485842|nr:sodium/substrate symporter small subunit [Aquibacillus kalidii]
MKKVDKKHADSYFRARVILISCSLAVGFSVSYLVVLLAENLLSITFNGFPLHYYMGAQGAVLTFIILLFLNAIVSDKLDKKYGFIETNKKDISSKKTLTH